MKLRTRGAPARRRRPEKIVEVEDEIVEDVAGMDLEDALAEEEELPPTPPPPRRQLPRRSVAPRAPLEPLPPARPRARAAPKGGVQKRKVVRPTVRPRPTAAVPAAPRATRVRRAKAKADDEPVLKEGKEEDVEGVEEAAADDNDDNNSKLADKSITTIDDLPEEVMLGIFSYFRPPQLCWKIGRVCRRWASWSVSPFLWRNKDYILSPDPSLGGKQNNK